MESDKTKYGKNMRIQTMKLLKIVDDIQKNKNLTLEQLNLLLMTEDDSVITYLQEKARESAISVFGKKIYIRGLIEFTNYCKNDCYYCGIRKSNRNAQRYRLDKEDILSCCQKGYELGFRTFVLQGGEDVYFTDERMCEIVRAIRKEYPDCAITLSIGERDRSSYQALYEAGANRFLLRHETADPEHYNKLHPSSLTLENRICCLKELSEIGYQVGCGFMVGSPGQTMETLWKDLQLILNLKPQMVGIGPFIPQHDTPFAEEKAGTMEQTIRLLAIIRLIHPTVLLPATTALGTIHPEGRELGILSGANVVMPNLSPVATRKKYQLYDNKICMDAEAAEGLAELKKRIEKIGYEVVVDRGDAPK